MALIRRDYIEQVRRMIYNGQPPSKATVTVGLVNQALEQGIGVAAEKNYKDALTLDGIAYINNSFYTTFKSLAITKDSNFLWKLTLPHVPYGLGQDEGVSMCMLTDRVQNSYPIVLMTQNQKTFARGMKSIPNKLIGYSEGVYIYILSTLFLNDFTATVTMVSGGLSTDLDSVLNVPPDYIPVITEYLFNYFMKERSVPESVTNDGRDFIKTT